jgi:hypothetical protein
MPPVLHFLNGDSTLITARQADLPGTLVAFRETLVTGPIVPSDWIETRARFLSDRHEQNLLRMRNDLISQEETIARAADADEVVLWFEHDLFCLANLLYLLTRLEGHRHVTLVWSEKPLGLMRADELHALFERRTIVIRRMFAIAHGAWEAYASPDPLGINRFLEKEESEFPFLREGFALHAARFPSLRNGLGILENRALELIGNGLTDFLAIFSRLSETVPKSGFGDGQVLDMLWHLAHVQVPILTMIGANGAAQPQHKFGITPAGEDVLHEQADFIELNGADFWLGGAHLTNERMWRWDAGKRAIVPSPPAA